MQQHLVRILFKSGKDCTPLQNALFVQNPPEWYTLSLPLMHWKFLLAQDCLFQLSSSLCHQASCMCLPHDHGTVLLYVLLYGHVLPPTSDAVYSAKTRLPISSRRLIVEAYMFMVCCRGDNNNVWFAKLLVLFSSSGSEIEAPVVRWLVAKRPAVKDKQHAKNLILVQLKWEEERGRNSSADVVELSSSLGPCYVQPDPIKSDTFYFNRWVGSTL